MKKTTLLLVSLFMTMVVNSQTVNLTKNPYAEVDWTTVNQYKANYHTHTTNSDGSQIPSEVVEEYGSKGYDILSITDHNVTTWPWPDNDYNMLAIKGNEYSSSHHMNAMLSFDNTVRSLENGIPNVQDSSGISQINHPGRYYSPADWAWYIPWFRDYSTCGILEVFNQGDRYPNDRKLWDNINENLFEETGELVWGSSNDDKHNPSHLYGNFNFMLMPELTQDSWEEAMRKGAFYFCCESGRSGNAEVPTITNIVDDNNTKTITISGTGIDSIQWIGVGTSVVATGLTFDYSTYTGQPFIRAILYGPNGNSYTQPFGFVTDAPNNNAPTCSITSPANDTHYSAPPRIIIDAAASDSDGNVTSVEFFVNGTSIGKIYNAPYSMDYNIPENGDYSITVSARDNLGSKTISSAVNITVGTGGTSTSARINSSMNDVEEEVDGGAIDNSSSDIELTYDGNDNQIIGLRFTGLDIPQGANIISANIQFTTDETNTGECNLTIKGENTGNSAVFTTANTVVSSRTTTDANVAWSPAEWNSVGESGADQRTPDISSIIQEIVDIEEYTSASAISIIITGSGERTAESYDGSSSQAPLLSVSYTTDETTPSNFAPEVTITSPSDGVNFDEGTSVNLSADASDSDGNIAEVEFFIDGTSIGIVTSAPYEQNWTIGTDTYNIYAVARDDEGAETSTSTVTITGVVPLASPWKNSDIGAVATSGSATYDSISGVFSVNASGADIWDSADEFHYIYQSFDGDGEIIARVQSLVNTNAWAKAGIMFRESLDADSKNTSFVVSVSNGLSFQRRTSTGGTTESSKGADHSAPVWVKMIRSGNEFTASYSEDGSSWTDLSAETINMSSTLYVGLCVTSHSDGVVTTSIIDSVTVTAISYPTVSITSPTNEASYTPGTNITISADAEDTDGTVSSVEFFQDETSIGTVNSEPYSMNFKISKGIHSFTAVATDNNGLTRTSDAVSVTVYNDNVEIINVPIANGDDDVEERESDGIIYLTSSDLELCYDTWNNQYHQTVGLRFQNVNIPQGATIENAYIQFTSKTSEDGEISLNIEGDDADNSSVFNDDFSISSRAKTDAKITWNPSAWTAGEAGKEQRTNDLGTIVQEIVNRAGWTTNNAMSFIITNDGNDEDKRTAKSTDNGYPPQLHIYYSTGMATSVDDVDPIDFGINVDPNPVSNGIINLEINSEEPSHQVLIFDINGMEVMKREVLSNKIEINVSELVKGMYFVKVTNTNGTATRKIIIE